MALQGLYEAIESSGLLPPHNIIPDGCIHRFSSDGRPGDDAGWYVAYGGENPAGAYGCWRTSVKGTWSARRRDDLSSAEREEHDRKIREAKEQEEKERQARQAETAARACKLWCDADSASADHPYLRDKGVRPHGIRVYHGALNISGVKCNGALVIPMRNAADEIVSVEFITADGEKRFIHGPRSKGACHTIGRPYNRIVVCEGYSTGASIHEATGCAAFVAFDAGNLEATAQTLRKKYPDAEIIIAADHDMNGTGQRAAEAAARSVAGLVAVPEHTETDWNDVHRQHGAEAVQAGIESAKYLPARNYNSEGRKSHGTYIHSAELAHADATSDESQENDGRPPAASKQLVALADDVELWHTSDGVAYGSIPFSDHVEHWPIRSRVFRIWLSRQLWEFEHRPAPSQAMQDALSVLEGMAVHDGVEHAVYVRLAEYGDNIYLDLADEQWQVIEISPSGWRVLKNAPVRFERRNGMKPLPVPVTGGSLKAARRFINVTDAEWPLVLAALVSFFNVRGPHAITAMFQEQGSGKTTNCRVMRRIVDPNEADLRSAPRDTRDLMIASRNGWICAFDNMSDLRPGLSDDLARLATGAGFATRALYSDDEEKLIHACRPIICNGISDAITRPDLLDRALVIRPPRIPDKDRIDERTFWQHFKQALPGILGALLDAVCMALQRRDSVSLEGAPRMADFARWVVAAEPALPILPGTFMAAYSANRQDAQDLALDADPVAQAIAQLLDHEEFWSGTAGELANTLAPEKPTKNWPKTGQAMAGALRRAAPTLRAQGYEVEYDKQVRPRKWHIRKMQDESDAADRDDDAHAEPAFQPCQSHVTYTPDNGEGDMRSDGGNAKDNQGHVIPVTPVTSEQGDSCSGEVF